MPRRKKEVWHDALEYSEHEETCYYNESAATPRMPTMDPDALLALVLRALRILYDEGHKFSIFIAAVLFHPDFPALFKKYANMALLGVTSPDNLANIPHVKMAACTSICAYQLFYKLPLVKPLTSGILGRLLKGSYNGVTVDPPGRLSAHKQMPNQPYTGKTISLHKRASIISPPPDAVITFAVPDEDLDEVSDEVKRMCPELIKREATVLQCNQVLLCTAEAVHVTATRNYKGAVLYNKRLTEIMGAPDPDVIGLNGTTCLTTGIPGLPQNAGTTKARVKKDREEEREAGIRAAARDVGLTVTVTCVKDNQGSSLRVSLPWRLEDDDTAFFHLYILPTTGKKLGLDSLKAGESTIGIFRLEEQSTPLSLGLMATIPDLLTLARHLPTLEIGDKKANVVGDVRPNHVEFLAHGTSKLLRDVGRILGQAPLEAIARPAWLSFPELEDLYALALSSSDLDLHRIISGRLGMLRSSVYYREGLFIGQFRGRHVFVSAADSGLGPNDKVEMLLGFDGQQLQTHLRLQDPTPTPVPRDGFRSLRTSRMDDVAMIDNYTAALSLPSVTHDYADIDIIPFEMQCTLLAAGTYPIKIVHDWVAGPNRVKEAVPFFGKRLVFTEAVNRAIGAGNRTTLRIDLAAWKLFWWNPSTASEIAWTGVFPDKILKDFQKVYDKMEIKPVLYSKAEFAALKAANASATAAAGSSAPSAPAASSSSHAGPTIAQFGSSASSAAVATNSVVSPAIAPTTTTTAATTSSSNSPTPTSASQDVAHATTPAGSSDATGRDDAQSADEAAPVSDEESGGALSAERVAKRQAAQKARQLKRAVLTDDEEEEDSMCAEADDSGVVLEGVADSMAGVGEGDGQKEQPQPQAPATSSSSCPSHQQQKPGDAGAPGVAETTLTTEQAQRQQNDQQTSALGMVAGKGSGGGGKQTAAAAPAHGQRSEDELDAELWAKEWDWQQEQKQKQQSSGAGVGRSRGLKGAGGALAGPQRGDIVEGRGTQGVFVGGSDDEEMAAVGGEKRQRESSSSKGKEAAGGGGGGGGGKLGAGKRRAGTSRRAVGEEEAEGSAGPQTRAMAAAEAKKKKEEEEKMQKKK